MNKTQKVAILGSTGSIGTQALALVRLHPDRLSVDALCAGSRVDALLQQAWEFRPSLVCIADPVAAQRVQGQFPPRTRVIAGPDALLEACRGEADVVLAAVVGSVGLSAVLEAIRNKKRVALANKEALVMGGQQVMDALSRYGGMLYPVDSEHSAIFQCLQNQQAQSMRRILLTASGGPFRTWTQEEMADICLEDALKHPNWSMGQKITIDSATMMNKGLEIIEARWLFDTPHTSIEVLVHPQSVVHSAVEFQDGTVLAQMGVPDMRAPIQYALLYPQRLPSGVKPLNLFEVGTLTFEQPDEQRFPCLRLARQALDAGGAAPAALNAANEAAVALFLRRSIGYWDIPALVLGALDAMDAVTNPDLSGLMAADAAARQWVYHAAAQKE